MPRRPAAPRSAAAAAAGAMLVLAVAPTRAVAIPVFARIYHKPCGACHTVYPQLNPEGERFRASGLHAFTPAIAPLHVAPGLDVPGPLPLAVTLAAGGDFITLELSPMSVTDVIDRVRALPEQLAHGRPVAFVCDCPPSLPVIHTDPLRLEQILTNLLTNAFKFTNHGTVTLRVRHLVAEGRVRFDVEDTGIGIPERELPHIFDEFRQVDGSMSREHGGIGLGLALVRRLVGLLGGDVGVTSRAGQGSTFTVTLPLDHPGAATADAGRAA